MAANRPNAVAISASAMPGATARSVAVLAFARPVNEVMTPHTVPNKPMNGATEAVVARKCHSLLEPCQLRSRAALDDGAASVACDHASALVRGAALKTGTSGVKRRVSQAVLISESFLPLRKIFQNVLGFASNLSEQKSLRKNYAPGPDRKMSRIARTNSRDRTSSVRKNLDQIKFDSNSISSI